VCVCLCVASCLIKMILTCRLSFLGRRSRNLSTYLCSIDQGTSSTRFMIFDRDGGVISMSQKEHTQHYPHRGWVEHDPEEIWKNTKLVIEQSLSSSGIKASEIAALGITNQRETTVVWNRSI
jgi:glycerol kinase